MAYFGPEENSTGTSSWMDIDTGDIYVKHDNGCGGGTIFRIPGKAEK